LKKEYTKIKIKMIYAAPASRRKGKKII